MAASGNHSIFTKVVFICLLPLILVAFQVFASPSNHDIFTAAEGNDAPKVSSLARRVSLYASSHDLAMTVSHRFNSGRRAGDSNPEIVAAAGIESIDVSEVDTSLVGHSCYGSNRSIITDIRKVLSLKKPEEREYLEGRELRTLHRKYWFFNPARPRESPAGI